MGPVVADGPESPDDYPWPVEAGLESRFRRRLLIFATQHLADVSLAEDVTQETLKRVVEALRDGRVDSLDSLPGFVYQTARHICQQRHRKSGREKRALKRLSKEPARGPSQPDPLANLVDAERRASVREALDRLEPADRELLRLLYYHESDYAHISEKLELTLGALRTRKHRALARLRKLLERRDSNEDSAMGT